MFQACIKIIVACSVSLAVSAAPTVFKEGEHYERINLEIMNQDAIKQHISQDQNKVQVIEFFSYGCYWCSQVHGPLVKWGASNKDVALYHYPATFNKLWRDLGRVYLSVQQCDNATEIDEAVFTAIHTKHQRVWEESIIKNIILEHGGKVTVFDEYYNSFIIQSKLKKSEDLANAYKIDATPYIIVHGPHASYVTGLARTRDKETLIEVINYLVIREQKFYRTKDQPA